jgi:hypothetical protein
MSCNLLYIQSVGGSSKGVAKVLAKYLMLYHLKLIPTFDLAIIASHASTSSELAALETDADVLNLPPIDAFADALNMWLPTRLNISTELDLKRAVVSACDALGAQANRLDVEVMPFAITRIVLLLYTSNDADMFCDTL